MKCYWQFRLALVALALTLTTSAWAQFTESTLYSFGGVANDAASPSTGLIQDTAGNLYGTTALGGTGFGTVYELSPSSGGFWIETLLFTFPGGTDGANPSGSLIFDASGNLYGVSQAGGTGNRGTVYELSPGSSGWTEQVLYSFAGNADGQSPSGSVAFDKAGNLYGTTTQGGGSPNCFQGCGTVFIMSLTAKGWAEKPIYAFDGGADGSVPGGNLLIDINSNIYGAALEGGTVTANCSAGCGTIFRLKPELTFWQFSRLFNFQGAGGGFAPGALTFDAVGNIYGATSFGGPGCTGIGCGVIFQLTPTTSGPWKEKVLHAFTGRRDGAQPAGVAFDSFGNLFGSANIGSNGNNGTVWVLTPTTSGPWTLTPLFAFGHGAGGARPAAGVTLDSTGNIFATTTAGGTFSRGTVIELAVTAASR